MPKKDQVESPQYVGNPLEYDHSKHINYKSDPHDKVRYLEDEALKCIEILKTLLREYHSFGAYDHYKNMDEYQSDLNKILGFEAQIIGMIKIKSTKLPSAEEKSAEEPTEEPTEKLTTTQRLEELLIALTKEVEELKNKNTDGKSK